MPVSTDSARGPTAQPVLSPLTGTAIFLVVTIAPEGEATARDLLGEARGVLAGREGPSAPEELAIDTTPTGQP